MSAEHRLLRYFRYDHLPSELQDVSKPFATMAEVMLNAESHDMAETVAGVRKLLEAKDCAVRAAIPATPV